MEKPTDVSPVSQETFGGSNERSLVFETACQNLFLDRVEKESRDTLFMPPEHCMKMRIKCY